MDLRFHCHMKNSTKLSPALKTQNNNKCTIFHVTMKKSITESNVVEKSMDHAETKKPFRHVFEPNFLILLLLFTLKRKLLPLSRIRLGYG